MDTSDRVGCPKQLLVQVHGLGQNKNTMCVEVKDIALSTSTASKVERALRLVYLEGPGGMESNHMLVCGAVRGCVQPIEAAAGP